MPVDEWERVKGRSLNLHGIIFFFWTLLRSIVCFPPDLKVARGAVLTDVVGILRVRLNVSCQRARQDDLEKDLICAVGTPDVEPEDLDPKVVLCPNCFLSSVRVESKGRPSLRCIKLLSFVDVFSASAASHVEWGHHGDLVLPVLASLDTRDDRRIVVGRIVLVEHFSLRHSCYGSQSGLPRRATRARTGRIKCWIIGIFIVC